MNATQLPFLVEAFIILAAMVLGGLLGRKAKPYGKVKLGFHLFFFLWFTMGYYYVAQVLFTGGAGSVVGVSVIVMGLALLVQIVTGLVMLFSKARARVLPKIHGGSAALVLVSLVVAFFASA